MMTSSRPSAAPRCAVAARPSPCRARTRRQGRRPRGRSLGASSTPRITRAPNAAIGARRRSATGTKRTTTNSRTSGHRARRDVVRTRPVDDRGEAPTTQSSAIQWPSRIRFVSGGRGGRDGLPAPGYAGYAGRARSAARMRHVAFGAHAPTVAARRRAPHPRGVARDADRARGRHFTAKGDAAGRAPGTLGAMRASPPAGRTVRSRRLSRPPRLPRSTRAMSPRSRA